MPSNERTVNLNPDEWLRIERISDGLNAVVFHAESDSSESAMAYFARVFGEALAQVRARLETEGNPCPKKPLGPGGPIWTYLDRLKNFPVNRYVCGRLRSLRQAKGLRVEDIARKSIPLGSYSCLELGRFRLSLENLFRVLAALGAAISDVWPKATSDGKPITRQSIRLAVKNAERRLPKRRTVAGILEAVTKDFGVTVADLASPSRNRRFSEARSGHRDGQSRGAFEARRACPRAQP